MTLSFLFMMNITMSSRLIFLCSDDRLSRNHWIVMILIQLLGLTLFEPGISLWLLLVFICVLNAILFFFDVRLKQSDLFRFIFLILYAVLFSIFFSPRISLNFNTQFLDQIRDWMKYSSIFSVVPKFGIYKLSLILFGLLLVSNEVNLLIRSCFHTFGLISTKTSPRETKYLLKPVDTKELNAGRVIGILERIIMYSMILGGSAGSIGFVLAAKAFTRFRELDERAFAEYILVGTLLSTFFAVMVAYFVQVFLQ
ncbi:hypothetical protein LTAR_02026 [Leptolinea tardivitalis]|nr:hypothetical protein LTAR_02026 [Leptolinea tardivitalis]